MNSPEPPAANLPATVVYERLTRRKLVAICVAGGLLLLTLLADIATGPAMLSLREVFTAILSPATVDEKTHVIVWVIRMPTALMAALVGMSLSVAGAEMQTVLDNPLASPYTLGVSAAAGFGAALALVCGAGGGAATAALLVPLSAFVFALLCSLGVYGVAILKRGSTESIILAGVALLFLFNAAVALIQYIATEDQLQAIVFWLFGSLVRATWPKVAVVAIVLLIVAPLIGANAWQLTALRLGDSRARSLGIDVERLRLRTLILISVLTAAAVCFVGAIGFIGLVAPHIARIFVGEDQRFFLPFSGLAGALLLSAASIGCKLIHPGAVFPIGIVTAFIGVPFFIAMILGKRRTHW